MRHVHGRGRGVPFARYAARRENIEDPCMFICLLNSTALETGDTLVMVGNRADLGGWDYGLDLHQHPENPNIWRRTCTLPFQHGTRNLNGLFEFKYAIRKHDGRLLNEEGSLRRTTCMVPTICGSFRPPRNAAITTPIDPLELIERGILDYEQDPGAFSAPNLLDLFKAVETEYCITVRQLETLLCTHIDRTDRAGMENHGMAILLVTAMIGQTETTRTQQLLVAGTGGGDDGGDDGEAGVTDPASPPLWCHRVIDAAGDRHNWRAMVEAWSPSRRDNLDRYLDDSTRSLHWCQHGVANGIEYAANLICHSTPLYVSTVSLECHSIN